MKMSVEERFRRKMFRIGKKNQVCRCCVIPVITVGMFLFHITAYFRGNSKRFATLGLVLLFSVVYSSFSFPAFIKDRGEEGSWNPISEEAQDIVLVPEAEINLEEIELLADEDVLLEGEEPPETAHGMDVGTRYSASDILEYNQDRLSVGREEGREKPGEQALTHTVFLEDDWRLILINKQHSIPEGYEEKVPLGKISTMKGIMHCDERIIDDLLDMIQAAKDDGVTLEICSPYRDLEYQEMLFDRKITMYMKRGLSYMEAYQLASQAVTVPNASEHQIGLALDIVTDSYVALNEGFAETDAGKWLAENSCEYGFILRYPKGKEDITGIEFEPWHFRYVGTEAATLIKEQGITLEEFWEEYL